MNKYDRRLLLCLFSVMIGFLYLIYITLVDVFGLQDIIWSNHRNVICLILTVAMIGGMCGQGDEQALESFRRVGEILASELKPLLEEFNIECLLFGGQISRSFAYFEPALKSLLDEVPTLKHLSTMQNLSTAAPLGILSMLRKSLNL